MSNDHWFRSREHGPYVCLSGKDLGMLVHVLMNDKHMIM